MTFLNYNYYKITIIAKEVVTMNLLENIINSDIGDIRNHVIFYNKIN